MSVWNQQATQQGNAGAITPAANSITAAAANAIVTLPANTSKLTYVEGFTITGTGATAASIVNAVLSGLATSNLTYNVVVPAGVNTALTPLLDVRLPTPLPTAAVNSAITLNVPSLGTNNTNVAVSIYGFYQ